MMKYFVLVFIAIPFLSFSQGEVFHDLKGAYLGQNPPGKMAQLFAPKIISSLAGEEMCAAFTNDGKEFFFNAIYENSFSIFRTKETNGSWTTPTPLHFSGVYSDRDFTISPDGNKIYFGSNRPANKNDQKLKKLNIYVTERKNEFGEWSEPQNLGQPINTEQGENYPSIATNGNLYFFSCGANTYGGCDLFVSYFNDGKYLKPQNLGRSINGNKHEWDAYIAPNESYIIFSSMNRNDTHGTQDLYISFQKNDKSWTKAVNMGKAVNSAYDEICPSVTLDGKYLFFTSRRRGKTDIYWIDAQIIENLKPKELKQIL